MKRRGETGAVFAEFAIAVPIILFLIFAMNRLDIFSMGDVGLRNGVNRLYNAGAKLDERATLEVVERWSPYRSVASWYLWRLTEADLQAWS